MIEIDGVIVSEDILTEPFCCDLAVCGGMCCVEGSSGAPLEPDEAVVLERDYGIYSQFMTHEGRMAVENQGFMVVDQDGDYTTPLIDNKECAYSYPENGITFCAIERAAKEGLMEFLKPLSCHLYPVRLIKLSNGSVGLNYHRWDICSPAVSCGRESGVKVYQALCEPIIKRFGAEFFVALTEAEKYLNDNRQR